MTCRPASAALFTAMLGLAVAPAQAACRQALVFGLDVSGSVDPREYRLQVEGLAAALNHPDVRDVLFAQPSLPVRISAFEWSGPLDQHMILPWTSIRSVADLDRAIYRLQQSKRASKSHSTAIGAAMQFGAALLLQQTECGRLTLDLSGDGRSNAGPRPGEVGLDAIRGIATVNALVIGEDASTGNLPFGTHISDLSAYYLSEVIRGPGAFVEPAIGFDDFQASMLRKLLRELKGRVIGRL